MSRTPLSHIPVFHEKHRRTPTLDLSEAKRYYSSIDADIYFGEIYIDEIVNIQFVVQQNAMPLYGYNSFVFDDMALGNRIVSGSFVINFTAPRYLFALLDELSSLEGSARTEPLLVNWAKKMGVEVTWDPEAQEIIIENERFKVGEIPGTRFDSEASLHYVENEERLLQAIGRGGVAEHRRSWANGPLWRKTFDIDIAYGVRSNGERRPKAKDMIIKDVYIVSCAQQFDINGEPIYEQYQFVGRDIRPL